jgi:acetylornithine deacetylase/succinyl-diaminopimelate desuccinylase-like protein
MSHADAYIDANLQQIHDDLFELLRIESISTDPAHAGHVAEAGAWVAARMKKAGLTAEVIQTDRHPLVLGRYDAGPDAPTLLVYAHYDVQPADPLEEWDSAPFEPEIRDGILYARGAADDKAQVILQIAAAEAALATDGLPVNLILLFEGEEEMGSNSLEPYVVEHAAALAPDHVVIADSLMFKPDTPSLIFGMRGMAYFEVEARTGDHDLHSGQYGGAVPNPAHALARIIASFHDDRGRVVIPGFYDDVADAPAGARDKWKTIGYDEDAYQRTAGGAHLTGEHGFATHERLWIRPCLDVNGMIAGYTGPGSKTVLPSVASAKVSCRLVPDQDPERIAAAMHAHVAAHAPEGVQVTVRTTQSNPAWRAEPTGTLYEAGAAALGDVYGVEPVRVCHGGSLPIARQFAELLTPSVAVMGFAVPGANMHAPNEQIPVSQLEKGSKSMVRLYRGLAERT